jgi:chromosome segregation protein
MRIRKLELIRYGKFTDAEATFPQTECDFHFIVGPNEAGKSTLRSAISELLYGFPARSAAMAFLHPQPELRLGAHLVDGTNELEFHRTKGNKNTLRTPKDAALPDDCLAGYQGASDRDFFEQMFGLDHSQLVRGGQTILDASKDVSQVLFQSAAGIAGLGKVKDALVAEADRLWAPRASAQRAYYAACTRWEEACKELKELTVRTKGWTEARDRLDEVERYIAEATQKKLALQTQRTRLERIRRLAPTVQALRTCQKELELLGEVLELPADAAATVQAGLSNLSVASTVKSQREEDVRHFTQQRDDIALDQHVIDAQHHVDELVAWGQRVRDHYADLETQKAERQRFLLQAVAAAQELGWSVDSDSIVDFSLPKPLDLRDVQRLVVSHGQLLQARSNTEQALADKQSETDEAATELASTTVPEVPTSLRNALSEAQGYKNTGSTQLQLKNAAEAAERMQKDHLSAMERPALELEALRAVSALSTTRLAALVRERQALHSALDTALDLLEKAQEEVESAGLSVSQYAEARRIVTGTEVRDARRARDEQWLSIKTGEVAVAQGAAALDAALLLSDELADTQLGSATEAAELQSLRQRLERANLDLKQRKAAETEKRAALEAFDVAWKQLCQSSGVAGLDLGDAQSWFSTRENVLQAASLADQKRQELRREEDAANSAAARLRTGMSSVGANVAEDSSLVALVSEAERLVSRIDADAARSALLQEQVATAATVLADLNAKVDKASSDYARWEEEWRQAVGRCLLSDFVKAVEDAEQGLQKVQVVRTSLEKAAATKKDRIDTMSADLDTFRDLAEDVLRRVEAADLSGAEPRVVAAQLSTRLADAKDALQRRRAAEESLEMAAGQLREAEQQVAQIHAKVTPLLTAAGVANLEAAGPLVERSDQRRALSLRVEQARQSLTQDSDGLGLDAVVAEVDACDLERLAADLTGTADDLEATLPLLTQLAEARVRAQEALKAISGGQAAAAAESRRQEALADMAEASERYIKVATAVTLLSWAIDRYRDQKQGPMLARAGAIFTKLTLGHYSKLFVDYEKTPLSLSALRTDGRHVEVSGMSEGTRDQLYLALRLAAVELHLDKSKSLPFVADDLFVNFDDERSTAGLEALRELSTKTQVLFLSHHDHLLPRVRQVFGEGVNVVALHR